MRTILLIGLLALAAPAAAQMADSAGAAESRERVAALGWLVGEWEGAGWIMVRGAGRQTFTSAETVEARLDGRVLVVEGLHHDERGNVVHNALGVIAWDAEHDRYVFHTWLGNAGGGGAANVLELTDDGFRWYPNSGGAEGAPRVVFDARQENGEWVETGTATLPEGRELQFFEMRLHRVE